MNARGQVLLHQSRSSIWHFQDQLIPEQRSDLRGEKKCVFRVLGYFERRSNIDFQNNRSLSGSDSKHTYTNMQND